MPLVVAPLNVDLSVIKVVADEKLKKHLQSLGIVKDAKITVIESINGNLIILIQDSRLALDYSIVHNVCLFFIKNFGDIIEERVISILEDIGFEIIFTDDMKNYRDNNYVCSNDILTETYGKSVSEDMANRIVGLILWKIGENSLYA